MSEKLASLRKAGSGGVGDLLPLDNWELLNATGPYGSSTYTFVSDYKSVIVYADYQTGNKNNIDLTFDGCTKIADEINRSSNWIITMAFKNDVKAGETVTITGSNIYKTFFIMGRN